MYYSKKFSIFQEAMSAGCISASDLALFIKAKRYDRTILEHLVKKQNRHFITDMFTRIFR